MRRDEETIVDIHAAAAEAIEFSRGLTRDQLAADRRTLLAVLHDITIVGEAVKRLSAAFRERHPSVPWADIAGMRDRLIHGYDAVDIDVVWDTLNRDLPQLLLYIKPLLPEEPA